MVSMRALHLLLGLQLVALAHASLFAVDLGSEFLKVSLIKPGRTPISVVVNEMSKRKSPALVGFVGKDRLLGEEAFSFSVRYPETIYARARDLLGKKADDPTIINMLKEYHLPYQIVPHPVRGVAAVKVSEDQIYSAEELVASILYYAKTIAEAQAGNSLLDAAIAVPAYFGQAQRQALLDAASLAGLNVIGLINMHTAAALQYGIERDFTNKTQSIILYNQGSGSTEVALVKYSSYTVKESGVKKEISQLEVKDVEWDHELGSNRLDSILAEHFAAVFEEKFKLSSGTIIGSPKAMAKLKKQVRRTKEMLSANSAAPLSVEELYEGRDFQASITRQEFEDLAASFFSRAAAPLQKIISRNNLGVEDIEAVELLGGGSRVPRLQAALSEALGGRNLDRHLDADEAIVLGAGLFAANLSTSFRLRKFGMTDLSMFGIQLSIDEIFEGPQPEVDGTQPVSRVRNLLPVLKKLPIKRVVHFTNLTSDPLKISLAYNTTTSHSLPPGVDSPHLGSFEVSGIDTAIKRYNTSGQVNLRFEADYSGLLTFDKAEASIEYTVMEEKIVTVKPEEAATSESKSNTTDSPSSSEEGSSDSSSSSSSKPSEDGDSTKETDEDTDAAEDQPQASTESADSTVGNTEGQPSNEQSESNTDSNKTAEGNAADAKPAVTRIQVPKVKTAKVTLKVGGAGWAHPGLAGEALATAKATIASWEAAERIKQENARSRNDLESYIIKLKEDLETDELLMKVTTEADRTSFLESLGEHEDWIYMEAEEETPAAEFRRRLSELKKVGDPMKKRAEELEQRPKVLASLREVIDLNSKVARAWEDTKPWISEDERSEVITKLEEFQHYLHSKEEEQGKRQLHEEPAFLLADLLGTYEKLDKLFNKVNNKKKPKPPPEPKANSTETGEDGTAESTAEGDEGHKTESSESQGSQSGNQKQEAKKDDKTGSGEDKKNESKGKNTKSSSKKDEKSNTSKQKNKKSDSKKESSKTEL